MPCLSGFELYSRWVPLNSVNMEYVRLHKLDKAVCSSFPTFITDN